MAAADAMEAWGKAALRADTEPALGKRVANAWTGRVYPLGGETSLSPAVIWFSRAQQIVRAFSEGVTIRSSKGLWLIIPTENAPQAGRGFGSSGRIRRNRRHAITAAEQRFGRLRYVFVHRHFALLVADGVRKRKGARGGYAPATDAARKRKDFEDGVVMFVLVKIVRMPKSINPDAVADMIGREGLNRFAGAFEDITQRRFGRAA